MNSAIEESFLVFSSLHDPGTRMHCERVAEMCVTFALRLRKDEAFVEELRYAAIFHDIGKVGVDRHVLNKPASFTNGEWAMVEMHPQFGVDILRPLNVQESILEAIRSHHENYDGTGYPDRLKGEAIPLMARIIRIVDTFDALRTARPDREALGKRRALDVMWLHQAAFDSVLLHAFEEMIESNHEPHR
jgi:putative nucleotidyltransferase with HDIG domain